MRAVRVLDWGRAPTLVEMPVPDPGPGQVRVRVAGCGLCHSDLAMAGVPEAFGQAMGWRVPFTLGHETAGHVDAVGRDVVGWAEGEAVALVSTASCGRCRRCRRGRENTCAESLVGRGYGRDGGLADHVIVDDPDRALLQLGGLDPRLAGPLTDAGATTHHAVARVAPRVGDDGAVVVLGAGGLGVFAIQLVRALTTARIVVADPDPERRALAARRGADDVVDGVDADTVEVVRLLLGDREVDAVLDLVGTDATIGAAAALVAPGGALGVVGAGGGTLRRPWFGGLPRDADVFSFQGSDLADARGAIALAAAGRLLVDTEPFALDDAEAAFAALEAGGLTGRIVLHPDPSPTPSPTPKAG